MLSNDDNKATKRKNEESDEERSKSEMSSKKARLLSSKNTERIDSSRDGPQDSQIKEGFRTISIKIPNNLQISEVLHTLHNANNLRNIKSESCLFNTDRLNEYNSQKERLFSEFANNYVKNSKASDDEEIPIISDEFAELLQSVDGIRKQKFKDLCESYDIKPETKTMKDFLSNPKLVPSNASKLSLDHKITGNVPKNARLVFSENDMPSVDESLTVVLQSCLLNNISQAKGGITSGTFHLRNNEFSLFQRRYDGDKVYAQLNSFCILFAGSFSNMKKVEKLVQDVIGSEGLLANSLHDTPGNTPNQNENDGLTIVYLVPLVNEQDYLHRFLTKFIPVASPNSTSLAISSVLAFEDKKSYLCHVCGRCSCKKPSEHVSVHSTSTGYTYHESHHKFDDKDYNTTALNAIAKYKQITETEDVAKKFIRTDKLLYDLYLFDCTFTFVGYSIMGTNYQYASRSLVNAYLLDNMIWPNAMISETLKCQATHIPDGSHFLKTFFFSEQHCSILNSIIQNCSMHNF